MDHVYMPVAIGPKNNPYIGYSGSTQPLAEFRGELTKFLGATSVGEGWPVYNLEERKLPGGYNIFAQRADNLPIGDKVPVVPDSDKVPPVLTVMSCIDGNCTDTEKKTLRFGQAVQRMQNLWGSCVDWDGEDLLPYVTDKFTCPADLENKLTIVKRFFKKNHEQYLALHGQPGSLCHGKTPLVPAFNYWEAMKHIYGWVPFNEGCGAGANRLADTEVDVPDLDPAQPKWNHARLQPMYIHELQYNHQQTYAQNDPTLLFNPYVQLIHDKLKMNAYGFSVDDAVGFMSELGSGLIFTVGGANGLENPDQFDYANGFSLLLGVPPGLPPNEPLIKQYGVCLMQKNPDDLKCENFQQDVTINGSSQISGFRVGTVHSYPIKVNFTDMKDNVYSVLVKAKFPDRKCPDETCPVDKSDVIEEQECVVRVHHLGPVHKDSARWCGTANPNQSRDGQLTKNHLSFGVPVDFLP